MAWKHDVQGKQDVWSPQWTFLWTQCCEWSTNAVTLMTGCVLFCFRCYAKTCTLAGRCIAIVYSKVGVWRVCKCNRLLVVGLLHICPTPFWFETNTSIFINQFEILILKSPENAWWDGNPDKINHMKKCKINKWKHFLGCEFHYTCT